jgi:hypothetical protein
MGFLKKINGIGLQLKIKYTNFHLILEINKIKIDLI